MPMSHPVASRFDGTVASGGLISAAVRGRPSCMKVVGTHTTAADACDVPSVSAARRKPHAKNALTPAALRLRRNPLIRTTTSLTGLAPQPHRCDPQRPPFPPDGTI